MPLGVVWSMGAAWGGWPLVAPPAAALLLHPWQGQYQKKSHPSTRRWGLDGERTLGAEAGAAPWVTVWGALYHQQRL